MILRILLLSGVARDVCRTRGPVSLLVKDRVPVGGTESPCTSLNYRDFYGGKNKKREAVPPSPNKNLPSTSDDCTLVSEVAREPNSRLPGSDSAPAISGTEPLREIERANEAGINYYKLNWIEISTKSSGREGRWVVAGLQLGGSSE